MSFFSNLVDSFSQLFSSVADPPPARHHDPQQMDAAAGPSVVSERIVNKLKGYFDLAKVEIDKAVRAEEWGLTDDAIAHYKNAHRVMLEAKAARVPSALPSSDQENVRTYQQKISKWQENVTERLQVLSKRTGGVSPKKTTISQSLDRAAASMRATTKAPLQTLPSSKRSTISLSGNQKNSNGLARPTEVSANNYDSKLIEMINTAIVDRSPSVKWDDVAGLEKAKQALLEMVILPTKRRDLFTGLRKPARGLLLFGPPGNGKTMLAKAVASESDATFFNLSASSLTSKWVGEAEKLVRTLFMVAISKQPSVIFIDELWSSIMVAWTLVGPIEFLDPPTKNIDSIMSTRMANENDASRRLKSEFLVQFDGVTSNPNDLVIVIGATNKPQEIDDAVLRRLVKRIYVPLPDHNVRRLLLKNQLKGQAFSLPGSDLERLVKETEGYSGSDLQALCEEAAMMPIRELGPQNILTIKANQLRPLRYGDFQKAMAVIRPSLQKSKWEELEEWNREFGSN